MKNYILLLVAAIVCGCGKDNLKIGQPYGGGIVIHVNKSGGGIIAAPQDQSTGASWGCYNTTVGCVGAEVGDGKTNTASIVAICNQPVIAAVICETLVLNGYDDWHLPSLKELQLIFQHRELLGTFSDANYWSSTESTAKNAWYVYFNTGEPHEYSKLANDLHIRAVRYYP